MDKGHHFLVGGLLVTAGSSGQKLGCAEELCIVFAPGILVGKELFFQELRGILHHIACLISAAGKLVRLYMQVRVAGIVDGLAMGIIALLRYATEI